MTTPGAAQFVDTPDTGLTADQVAARVAAGQLNTAPGRSSRTIWEIVKANVFTRFNAILGALFVLVLIAGSLADGLFGLVLIVNSAIGIVQEYLAKRKLDRLALLNAPTALVVRDGREVRDPDRRRGARRPDRTARRRPGAGRRDAAIGGRARDRRVQPHRRVRSRRQGRRRRGALRHHGGCRRRAGSSRLPSAPTPTRTGSRPQVREFTRTNSEIQASVNKLLGYITWIIVFALPLQLWSQARVVGDQGWQTGGDPLDRPAWSGWCPRVWCC